MRGIEPIVSWLDERLGVRAIGRALFARKIPAGTGWIYTLGSITFFLFVLQLATGTLLATSYAPTPDHAFDSVRYITEEAPFGSFLRGLHVWGATVMVVAVLLHTLRTFMTGSYKFPRELTWMSGALLIMLVLGFGFTGYLLPWNQKAYWATQVGARLAEQVPLLGPAIARLLLGGGELGPQTLTRFYAVHVLVLPAIVVSLIAVHLFMVVRQGISAPPRRGEATAIASDRAEDRQRALAEYARRKEGGKSFYPYTLAKDAVAIFLVLALVASLAWYFAPEVGEIADATETSFNPRPEWYFLWLFQFLKYFPGNLEVLGAVVLPTVGFALLFALPLLDRSRHRHPLDRPFMLAGALGVLALLVGLTIAGARSPLATAYVPMAPTVARGARIFHELHCESCHSVRGRGGTVGPDLAVSIPGHDSAWIRAHFRNPAELLPGSPMPAFGLLDDEIEALVAYVEELRGGGPPSENAPELFGRYCTACHELGGRGGHIGPSLDDIGSSRSRSFLHRYIEDPKSLFTDSRMPSWLAPRGPLSHEQIEDLARFLAAQHGQSARNLPSQSRKENP